MTGLFFAAGATAQQVGTERGMLAAQVIITTAAQARSCNAVNPLLATQERTADAWVRTQRHNGRPGAFYLAQYRDTSRFDAAPPSMKKAFCQKFRTELASSGRRQRLASDAALLSR